MAIKESCVYIVCFFFTSCFFPAKSELQLVHVLFRHGQRTPVDTYPNDPYINFTYPPFGLGALTNKGKLDQYLQGQYLRTRYGEFLGNTYSADIIYAQSTGSDRTVMSAQLELAGLWPPTSTQIWNPELLWQPIPVHSDPLEKESLLLIAIPCPRYDYEREKVVNSSEVQDILNAYNATKLYETLYEITGKKYEDVDDVMSLFSTLTAQAGFNLTFPEWTFGIYPEKLLPLTVFSYVLNVYNSELQKLRAGPLLKKIVDETKAKAEGILEPQGRKMFMYSGHDSTIVNILSALRVWDPQVPNYGIMVLIELHYDNPSNRHYIKLFLRNSTDHEPYALTMPGCETSCPLEEFNHLTSLLIPVNWEEDCKVHDPNYVHSSKDFVP